MDRFQFVTKAVCPEHGEQLYVVIALSDDGDFDVWKGCWLCPGSVRLGEKASLPNVKAREKQASSAPLGKPAPSVDKK